MSNASHEDSLRFKARNIDTLDIEAAAALAYCSVPFMRRKAQDGDIPGAARMGRRWCFVKVDLLAWIRAGSPCKDVVKDGVLCRLNVEMDTGMLTSPLQEQEEYADLLDLPTAKKTKQQRKNGMTSSRQSCGAE